MSSPADRPVEQELRLRSPVSSIRAGARWEQHVERVLAGGGWQLDRHPAMPGTSARPDLLAGARDDPGTRFCIEATATGGGSLAGHRQPTPELRLHDVLMSRLKHKSRALQGLETPLAVAVLCIAPACTHDVAHAALAEFLGSGNPRGRNVSGVVVAWDLCDDGMPRQGIIREHPWGLMPLPPAAVAALGGLVHP